MATQPTETLPANTEQAGALPAITPEGERFALRQRQARMFAMSPLVPDHLRKGTLETAIANCWIALTLAEAMGEVPLIVMQNIHIVNGKAGFASQYMIARANNSGVFKGRIDWRIEGKGETLSVTAYAVLKETGQEVSVTCDMAMAKAEQWTRNSKYQTMPEVMLRYRSAAFLVRFYAPDVMLGYQTIEEVVDVALAAAPSGPPLTAKMIVDQSQPEPELPAHDADTGEIIETDATAADDQPAEVEAIAEEPEQPAAGATLLAAVDQGAADPATAKCNELIAEIKAATSIGEITALWGRNAGHFQVMDKGLLDTLVQVKNARVAEIQAAPAGASE